MKTVTSLQTVDSNLQSLVDAALEQSGGLLRLAPCWVPRAFLQPGRRLKLHPDDIYAYGLDRGGIDERWFGSTTPAANDNRTPDEGLSYCVFDGKRFTLAGCDSRMRSANHRRIDLEQIRPVAGLLQVFR